MTKLGKKVRGHLWFINRYGLRRWLRYECTRRSGALVNYSEIFNPGELAILEEHGLAMWTRCDHDWHYFEDPEHDYTGYLERCSRCGQIAQIVQ